ncbi:MAG: hypothetical protein LBE98_02390 [Puniceicoccales bacterium]|jgi:hypothetical protein|nr:hypothetical protein [Puniceicoccales bacterium]
MDLISFVNHYSRLEQPVQSEEDNVIPEFFSDLRVNTLLNASKRYKNHTPGNGHNNCGFNAILEQVGDRTSTHEIVNLLRSKLGYGDESSNENFDTLACQRAANLFRRPVVEICYNSNNKIVQLSFSIPRGNLSIHLKNDMQLSQNFVAWCINSEWSQEEVDVFSQWLVTNVPGTVTFGEATLYDIALQLLQCPMVIALVAIKSGGHFDAAPHKDLQREASVLEFLRRTES